MDDTQIVQLYRDWNGQAILATADKYGNYCTSIASNVLGKKPTGKNDVDLFMVLCYVFP